MFSQKSYIEIGRKWKTQIKEFTKMTQKITKLGGLKFPLERPLLIHGQYLLLTVRQPSLELPVFPRNQKLNIYIKSSNYYMLTISNF